MGVEYILSTGTSHLLRVWFPFFSSLEVLLIDRKMRGPGWIDIKLPRKSRKKFILINQHFDISPYYIVKRIIDYML